MYKTIYKSNNRIKSYSDALQVNISPVSTDFFLYLIDLYDVLLHNDILDTEYILLKNKLKNFLLKEYDILYKPIPGCLLGWTHAMFLWVVYLTLLNKRGIPALTCLDYIKKEKLRQFKDPNPTTWTWDIFVNTLDILSLKWDEISVTKDLYNLLDVLWHLAAKFTLFIHTKDVLSVDNHVDRVSKTKYHVRLSAESIVSVMSRFVGFNRSIHVLSKWFYEPDIYLHENNFTQFLELEKRHLVTRKFRDNILNAMWDKIILIGDKEIASHDQLGETVSAYTCLFKRSPTGQITNWQRLLTYKEYDEIIKDTKIKQYLHLHMIDQHFHTIYNVNFIKYFTVFNVFKYIKHIETCQVPLILNMKGSFDVFYRKKIYRGGEIEKAFIIWAFLLKTKLNSKPYSMDFSMMTEQLFSSSSSDEEVSLNGFFTLEENDL